MGRIINLLSEDFLLQNEKIYFVAKETNIFYNLDLNSGELEFVGCIPEESIFESRLCAKILAWKHEMIFIPMNAKKVWRYNTIAETWHGIDLGKYGHRENKIFQAIIYGNDLFMIGCSCAVIFQLNLITEQLIVIEKPFRYLKNNYSTTIYFRCDFVQHGTEVFMASCADNSVMKFDLQKRDVFFYKIGNEENQYSGIAWDGKDYWLSPRYKTPLVKWDGKDNVTEYELPYKGLEMEIGFLGIIVNNGCIVLPGRKNCSIVISNINKNCSMQIIEKAYVFLKKEKENIFGLDIKGNLVIESDKERKMFRLSTKTDSLIEFQLKKADSRKSCFNRRESHFFELNNYVKEIAYLKGEKNTQQKKIESIGEILKKDIFNRV